MTQPTRPSRGIGLDDLVHDIETARREGRRGPMLVRLSPRGYREALLLDLLAGEDREITYDEAVEAVRRAEKAGRGVVVFYEPLGTDQRASDPSTPA